MNPEQITSRGTIAQLRGGPVEKPVAAKRVPAARKAVVRKKK